MLKNLSRQGLQEQLSNYRFNEVYNMKEIFQMIFKIDEDFDSFAMLKQSKRVYILPYLVIFYTNDTVILNAFYKFFNLLKTAIFGTFDKLKYSDSPRIVVHGNMVIVDVYPTGKLRASYHLYVINATTIIIDTKNVEELDTWQEAEVIPEENNKFSLR
jgi:calcineurin-like phosphoesterase